MTKQIGDTLGSIRTTLIIVGSAILLVIFLIVVRQVFNVLLIFFAGVLLAVFLDGLAGFVQRKTPLSRYLSLFLVIVILIGIFISAERFAGPKLIDEVVKLLERLPQAMESLRNTLLQYQWSKKLLTGISETGQVLPLGTDVLGGITGLFSSIFSGLITILIILFIGFYLAVNPHMYIQNGIRLLPTDQRNRAREVFHALGHALRWWLAGRISSMIVVGILTAIGLSIIGVPLAIALGFVAALFSFVPYVGPILSVVPAALVALAEEPILVVYTVIVYSIVQLLESYLITPLIQERAVSIPPAVLILMQILMGVLAGAFGVLLATPLAVIIIVLVQMLYIQDVLGDKIKILGEH